MTVFLARRAIIGLSIAFCRDLYFVQLEILLVTSLFCLCFVILVRPYATELGNKIEIVNESLVFCTIYLMHCFSFFIPSIETRYSIGWAYVAVVGIVFAVNMLVLFKAIVEFVITTLRNEKKGSRIRNQLKSFIRMLRTFVKKSSKKRLA